MTDEMLPPPMFSEDEVPTKPRPVLKQRRGFACMDPDKRTEIARKGGLAAQASGTAHRFSSEEARVAGRKGGLASQSRRGTDGGSRDGNGRPREGTGR